MVNHVFGSLPALKFVVQFGYESGGMFQLPSSPAFQGSCLTPRAADLGYVPRFQAFSWLRVFSVSAASPLSYPKRLTPAVGRSGFRCQEID